MILAMGVRKYVWLVLFVMSFGIAASAQDSRLSNNAALYDPSGTTFSDKKSPRQEFPAHTLRNNISVLGWHVYWLPDFSNYDYSLLTHIAYFGCPIDVKNGTISKLNGWDTTSIITYAKHKNSKCKVVLTVTCFGQDIDMLLRDTGIQEKLIRNLVSIIKNRSGDGICLDIEWISSVNRGQFSVFMAKLKSQFKQANLLVFLTLPSTDYNMGYDIPSISCSVDRFILLGYTYSGPMSYGPAAPLTANLHDHGDCIANSVAYYINEGVSPQMLILGVPYYGAIWESATSHIPPKDPKFIGYRSYSYALPYLSKFSNDGMTGTSHYIYKTNEMYRHFWMETEYSLSLKYDYVLKNNFAGIAIWALGYDGTSPALWNLLAKKFAVE